MERPLQTMPSLHNGSRDNLQPPNGQEAECVAGTVGKLKRQRDSLSDNQENIPSVSEPQKSLKRQCLDPKGDENVCPWQQRAESPVRARYRQVEQEMKPDTPAVPSIRSRLQLLAQRQGTGDTVAQPCLSGPELNQPYCSPRRGEGVACAELRPIGYEEFRSRVERFEHLLLQESPALSTPRSRTLSSLTRSVQQRLQSAETPSASRASHIRQEREKELSLLCSQPISKNTWIRRSLSDPSLAEKVNPVLSLPQVSQHCRTLQWPPVRPWDQVEQASQVDVSGRTTSHNEQSGPAECNKPTCQDASLEFSEELHSEAGGMMEDGGQERAEAESPGGQERAEAESPGGQERAEVSCVPESSPKQTVTSLVDCQGRYKEEISSVDANLKSEEEMSTSVMIDGLFEGVLNTTEEEEGMEEDCSTGKGRGEESMAADRVRMEQESLGSSVDELLCLPPNILSPLSKSVEAVVTPLRLASNCLADSPLVAHSFEQPASPPTVSAPLYSIDAYRTQQKSIQTAIQSLTPARCAQQPQTSCSQAQISTKERIKILNEDAAKLQGIISQTLQALSCCTDEDHGKGSQVEAEAERLLLLSCEKRTALLVEVSRLRAEGDTELGDTVKCGGSQEPCRGTVRITNIQLPLSVEFVCSSKAQTGSPTHYFFVLIRHGPYNIVATPLGTAADAWSGDTISFSTSVTLEDIRPSFEIDVEVYSLSQTSGNSFHAECFSSKSKATPKKFLSSIKKSNQSMQSAMLTSVGLQRSSNFCLVGSHKITLASLGQNKFPLDKMKFDGKIKKLLGDEFQEKVPFLSPLEGNIYMKLDCVSHSSVQHRGFLTMFEDLCGFGAWQRRWFVLDGAQFSYWSYPTDEYSKPPEGSIKLASHTSQWVRPVKRDSCARPHTFELVSSSAMQEHNGHMLDKCWFAADTQEERAEWMEKLNQALLDQRSWTSFAMTHDTEALRLSRESIL